jgi:GNAT superfamily N-acetyltransferase
MTPAGLVVRRATDADLSRCIELITLGVVPGAQHREHPEDLSPYREALHAIDAAGGEVLVAEISGEVVGVCQLIVFRHLQVGGGLCAEIESVHVHPDHRRVGIGELLVRAAVARASALGCYRVQLTSNTARADAHRFYERIGFTPSHIGFKMPLP